MPTKIVLAGEGGQGVQAIAKILAVASIKSGKNVSYLPSFGVEQRGGVSLVYLQISSKEIPYPRFQNAEMVVCFCTRAVEVLKKYIQDNTLFLYDNSAVDTQSLEKVKDIVKDYLAIPAQSIGREKLSSKVANVILLGAITAHLKEISYQEVENAILSEFADKIAKKPEIKDLNIKALKTGLDLAEKFDKTKVPFEGSTHDAPKRTFSKEGLSWERFPEYCKGCGLCLEKCPVGALSFAKEAGFLGNPLPECEIEKCIGCKICEKICPDGAIKVIKSQ